MEKTLGMFGNLIGVVLGDTHPLTTSFREFWTLLQTNVKEDLHAAIEYRGFVKPTHILRSLQLLFYTWFAHKRAHLTPPSPDMKSIVHQILMQVYMLPHLPPSLYNLAYPRKPVTPGSSIGTPPGTISTTGSSSQSAGSRPPPGASPVSGLTTPTVPPPPLGGRRSSTLRPTPPYKLSCPATYASKT